MLVKPFKIDISEEVLEDLNNRLAHVRWPGNLINQEGDRGIDKSYLQSLVSYWHKGYNWRLQENDLNQYAQFTTNVDGVNIHFMHIKGKGKNPMPLILTHGWPDSFLRYKKVIPILTDPASFGGDANDSFDVIIPSLPGFGFSSPPEFSGCNNSRVADLWAKLMTENLGYKKFAAAGGDIGSGVTRYLALQHQDLLVAIYLNDVGIIKDLLKANDIEKLSTEEIQYQKNAQQWIAQEGGYMSIQSTKPQTLAYGLSDSPVGLAAWIIEKFRSWSDCNGDLQNSYSMDELITNVMIYWLSNTIGTSAQMYFENTHSLPPMGKIAVPTGLGIFPKDILLPPKVWAEKNLNIVHWSEMPRGGHFAAMEEPILFTEDMTKFFRLFRDNS